MPISYALILVKYFYNGKSSINILKNEWLKVILLVSPHNDLYLRSKGWWFWQFVPCRTKI